MDTSIWGHKPKTWADMSDRERRLLTLIHGAWTVLNTIEGELSGEARREPPLRGAHDAIARLSDARNALQRYCPMDISDDTGEPEFERRAREQEAIWDEVSPAK